MCKDGGYSLYLLSCLQYVLSNKVEKKLQNSFKDVPFWDLDEAY